MKLPALVAAVAVLTLLAGCGSPDQPTESKVSAAPAASVATADQVSTAKPAAPPPASPVPDTTSEPSQASKVYAIQPFEQLGVAVCDQLASDVKQCLDTQPESFDRSAQRQAFERAVRKWQNQIKQGADQATMSQTCVDFRNRIRDQLAKMGCVAI